MHIPFEERFPGFWALLGDEFVSVGEAATLSGWTAIEDVDSDVVVAGKSPALSRAGEGVRRVYGFFL